MSQIQTFLGSIIPPGGPVVTLTGDFGPAVGPDGAGNINIEGIPTVGGRYGFAVLVSAVTDDNPAPFPANTLKVEPLLDTVSTNDATATVMVNTVVPIGLSESWVMSANVIGNRDDFSAACGGFVTGVVRRGAVGNAVLVGDNALASEDAPAGTPQFGITLNVNNLFVYVQGLAGETWNWTCTFTFQKQVL